MLPKNRLTEPKKSYSEPFGVFENLQFLTTGKLRRNIKIQKSREKTVDAKERVGSVFVIMRTKEKTQSVS